MKAVKQILNFLKGKQTTSNFKIKNLKSLLNELQTSTKGDRKAKPSVLATNVNA